MLNRFCSKYCLQQMKNPQFDDLVDRYFRGKLVGGEYTLLTELLQNRENLINFNQKKASWNLQPERDELSEKNWAKLNQRISVSKSIFHINRRQWLQVGAVAALLAVGVLIGSVVSVLTSDSSTMNNMVIETPRGEKSHVTLPDGTEVWLNAKSKLVVRGFTSRHRPVELTGEAFFKVAHNAGAPFTIKTRQCDVKVLGTTFNVMAYEEFGRDEVTLLEGKVNVTAQQQSQILSPGQTLVVKGSEMAYKEVSGSQASGWVENKFNFHNVPLSELVLRLENWYDVDITLDNPKGRDVNFTGTFKNEETIWQVLDAIKIYTPIEYEKSNLRKIKITISE